MVDRFSFIIRIDPDDMDIVKKISEMEMRSVNSQLSIWIKKNIIEWRTTHADILPVKAVVKTKTKKGR